MVPQGAEQGHSNAQLNLGRMYEKGLGVQKDDAKAAEWYRKAAEQGMIRAQFGLAVMYEEGRGIEKDESKAEEWYRKAAEQEDADAQSRLVSLSARKRSAEDADVKADMKTDIGNICVFTKNAIASAAGARHYFVLLKDGSLFAWGDSAHGQTGVCLGGYVNAPRKILSNVINIAAGRYHSVALLADGTVLTWGEDESGQTGRGREFVGCVPRRVGLPRKAVKVFASGNLGAALLENGEIWIWGKVDGLPMPQISTFLPLKTGTDVLDFCLTSLGFAFLEKDGKVTCLSNTSDMRRPVVIERHEFKTEKSLVSIGLYEEKLFLLDNSGDLFEVGLSDGEELPDNLSDPVFRQISEIFAFDYGIFLKCEDGALMASGENFSGEINPWVTSMKIDGRGRPDCRLSWHKTSASGIAHVASHVGGTLLTDVNGRVLAWGDGVLRAFLSPEVLAGNPIKLIEDCRAHSHSESHSLALDGSGRVWAWGTNSFGELGKTSEKNEYMPLPVNFPASVEPIKIAAVGNTSFMLDKEGNLWVWGYLSEKSFAVEKSGSNHAPQIIYTGVRNFIPCSPDYIWRKGIGTLYIEYHDKDVAHVAGYTTSNVPLEVPVGAINFIEEIMSFVLEYENRSVRFLHKYNSDGTKSWETKTIDAPDTSLQPDDNADDADEEDDDRMLIEKDGDVVFIVPVSHPAFKKNMKRFPIKNFIIKNDYLVVKENAVIVEQCMFRSFAYKDFYNENVFGNTAILRDNQGKFHYLELTTPRTEDDQTFEFRPVLTIDPKELKEVWFYDEHRPDRALAQTTNGDLWGIFLNTPYHGYPYAQPDRRWENGSAAIENIEPGIFSTEGVKFESVQLREMNTFAMSDDGTLWLFGQDTAGLLHSNLLIEETLRPTPVQWGAKKVLICEKHPIPYELILFKDGTLCEYSPLLRFWFGLSYRKFPFNCSVKDICSGFELKKKDDDSEIADGETYYALLENGKVYAWMRSGCEALIPLIEREIEYLEDRSDDKTATGPDTLESLRRDLILCQNSKPYEVLFLEGVESFVQRGEEIYFISHEQKELHRIRSSNSDISCSDPRADGYYELDANGDLYGIGDLNRQTDDEVETGDIIKTFIAGNIARITSDGKDTIALTKDGKLVAWGENENGRLGTGDKRKYSEPQHI